MIELADNPNLTLKQRKLVSHEIAKEYRSWRRKKGEPSEEDRAQIVRIGFEKARRKMRSIPAAANPLVELGPVAALGPPGAVPMVNPTLAHSVIGAAAGAALANALGNPLTQAEVDRMLNTIEQDIRSTEVQFERGQGGLVAHQLGRAFRALVSISGYAGLPLMPYQLKRRMELDQRVQDLHREARRAGFLPATGDENPTGYPFSGPRYYRPAIRMGGRTRRIRTPLTSPMREQAEEHFEQRRGVIGDNPKGPYPFSVKQAQYRKYTPAQLAFAQKDALEAAQVPWEDPATERYYMDDYYTISDEIRRRQRSVQPNPLLMTVAGNPLSTSESSSLLRDAEESIIEAEAGRNVEINFGRAEEALRSVFAFYTKMGREMKRRLRNLAKRLNGLSVARVAGNNPACLPVCMNPGHKHRGKRKGRKITMSLEKFARMIRSKNDPTLWQAFVEKLEGYRKWTHGSLPKRVTLEQVDVPGMEGLWMTYDAGKQPEALYAMPPGSKRKGFWRHPWETPPSIKHDPQARLVITKLAGSNVVSDFYHG